MALKSLTGIVIGSLFFCSLAIPSRSYNVDGASNSQSWNSLTSIPAKNTQTQNVLVEDREDPYALYKWSFTTKDNIGSCKVPNDTISISEVLLLSRKTGELYKRTSSGIKKTDMIGGRIFLKDSVAKLFKVSQLLEYSKDGREITENSTTSDTLSYVGNILKHGFRISTVLTDKNGKSQVYIFDSTDFLYGKK